MRAVHARIETNYSRQAAAVRLPALPQRLPTIAERLETRSSSSGPRPCAATANETTVEPSNCRILRIHYLRADGLFQGWGLQVWGEGVLYPTSWDTPMPATGCAARDHAYPIRA
jgi:hypothetical protein